ncbi:MAG TPA: M20/M25/M40 family metallo-hydrolase [Gemmatimonadales bacterium]|nr:M20/M25/M40 family metallo-hydrolase [Gemmatimonadales bacterium]
MQADVQLLSDLVAIPSVSGTEQAVAEFVEHTARGWGLDVVRDETSVRVEVSGFGPGACLALVSHLDTVPAGSGWTKEPFSPVIEGARLYGRGSGDAKASVAAMLLAARDLAEQGRPDAGRVVVVLGYGEETKHTSMEQAVERLGQVDAAVIGEPTNLHLAIAQRGLMMVDLVARGEQGHAAYVAHTGAGQSAVAVLARDLVKLESLFADRLHPVLGVVTATPTMLEAGVSRNVTPQVAKAVLDVRSTPAWSHGEIAERLRETVVSDVVVTSQRLVPCETPEGSRLLLAAGRVRPGAERFGSPTCSDWVFLRHADCIKCGPGTSRRSHTPDEYVDLPELGVARAFYADLAREYLKSG